MKEEYIFPENNWYIEVTDENRQLINDWKINQSYNNDLFQNLDYKYVYYDGSGGTRLSWRKKVVINIDQFKQCVLKQPVSNNENDNYESLNKLLKQIL